MAITFQNHEISFKLSNKKVIADWIKAVVTKEKKKCGQINFLFMDDEALLAHNMVYLNHDTFTDILTFQSEDADKISGDIMISLERVLDNAQKFKVDFEEELFRVMIHGVLHLCGYKDKKKAEKELMRKMEAKALKLLK
jgi:rRNA maturation RNase YbeY